MLIWGASAYIYTYLGGSRISKHSNKAAVQSAALRQSPRPGSCPPHGAFLHVETFFFQVWDKTILGLWIRLWNVDYIREC